MKWLNKLFTRSLLCSPCRPTEPDGSPAFLSTWMGVEMKVKLNLWICESPFTTIQPHLVVNKELLFSCRTPWVGLNLSPVSTDSRQSCSPGLVLSVLYLTALAQACEVLLTRQTCPLPPGWWRFEAALPEAVNQLDLPRWTCWHVGKRSAASPCSSPQPPCLQWQQSTGVRDSSFTCSVTKWSCL